MHGDEERLAPLQVVSRSLSRSSVINVGHSFEQPPIELGRVRTFARDKPVRQSSDRYRGAQVPVRCVGGVCKMR